jgi:hypothetical protein
MDVNELKKLSGLTPEEVKLFKDDPETFREYLKYKTRQMEIALDLNNKDHEERMRAMDMKLEEQKERNRAEYQMKVEADDRRDRLWATILMGAGALCDFLAEKDEKNKTLNNASHQGSEEKSYYDPQKEAAIADSHF